jgi:hypothetical protein
LRTKERYATGLELVLRERLGKIDELTALVDRLRQQNKKLDAECEHLVEMVRFAPQLRLGAHDAKPPGFSWFYRRLAVLLCV